MKKTLFFGMVLCGLPLIILSQGLVEIEKQAGPYGTDIFSKNTWNFSLNQSFGYKTYSITENEQDEGSASEWNYDVEANYFLADHYGIGGRLVYRGERRKYPSEDIYRNCRTMAFVNGVYGRRLGDRVNFMLKGAVGLGTDRSIFKESGGETIDSDHLVFGAEIGAGFPLRVARAFHLTPSVGYRYRSYSDEDYSRKTNGLFVELNIDLFFPCESFFCDIGNDFSSPSPRYEQGTAVIGSRALGMFKLGSTKREWDLDEGTLVNEENITRYSLMGNGYYYVVNKVAVGAGLEWSFESDSEKDSDEKTVDHSFIFMPMIMLHPPVDNAAENLFLEVGYGIGTKVNKEGPEDDQDKTSYLVQKFAVGLGYNYFITEKTALTPFVQYARVNDKNNDTDIETTYSGLNAGISWNIFF